MDASEAKWPGPSAFDGEDLRFDLRRDLVATADASGYFTSLNRAWERVLGWSREELMSRPFVEFLHPDDIDRAAAVVARGTEPDGEVIAFDDRLRRKDGTWAWLRWHARTDGKTWFGVAIDITAEREAERRIASAIEEDRLLIYGQPILDGRTGEPIQEELLVRLREGDEVLPPSAFLPDAELSGAIRRIDRWMFERALELAAAGRPVAVNISPLSVADSDLMREIAERLAGRAEDASRLSFEITETAALGNIAEVQEFATRLAPTDCELALDDFGTGSASFIHLRDLRIDGLKIDRAFIAGLATSPVDRAVCHAIASVARELGLFTVAEGIEDQATLERVRELGADRVQGYLFARPRPI